MNRNTTDATGHITTSHCQVVMKFSVQYSSAALLRVLKSPKLLHKYLAAYAANLIKENKVTEALGLYVQHGAPAAKSVLLFVDRTTLEKIL